VVFLLFVFLFLNTEYKDNDVLPYAVNLFLRLDPLMAGAATLAGRALIGLVWPALVVALLTVALGRFFCGWFCPLGAVIDAAGATVFRKARRKDAVPASWKRYKFLVLFFLAASSLFTLQWVFLFDPISILIRTFTVSVFPALNLVLHQLFDDLYRAPGPIPLISEPVYGFLKSHFLAFEQPVFRTSAIVGFLFLGILVAERYQRRFWCRNLCPLGGLLALMGRFGLFRRRITEAGCTRCGLCD
jgi:polyferredoxin